MRVKTLPLALLLTLPAYAEWPRLLIYEKGIKVDHPPAYPMIAYTKYPRTIHEDVCYPCSPELVQRTKEQRMRTELKFLGKANGLSVYDLFFYWGDETHAAEKSILVQTAANRYREIYFDSPNEGAVQPSFLVPAGKETLVCVLENLYRSDAEDDCFRVSPEGVFKIDFTPVWKAAQIAAPAGRRVWGQGVKAKTTFKDFILPVGLRYDASNRCCDQGVVYVHFQLADGRITVTRAVFDPDAEPANPF
jgi:hypothetical protein